MELEVLVTAVTELANDQKDASKQIAELGKEIKGIREKVYAFSDKLASLQVVAPAPDTRPMVAKLSEYLQKATDIQAAQPKNVVRQVRFLLFPADNADHYYRIIFGRLFGWGVLTLVCIFMFGLGQQYIQTSSATADRRYNYEVFQDAWNHLDTLLGPTGRKKMQQALQQAQKDQ
ncbi:MAG TPA: hypothetical protein VHS53_08785 [Mucilaginibacter sp.]|jgi:hypothetical protein|nr:hypothetical protein [Mucilaginibacter sp.]